MDGMWQFLGISETTWGQIVGVNYLVRFSGSQRMRLAEIGLQLTIDRQLELKL